MDFKTKIAEEFKNEKVDPKTKMMVEKALEEVFVSGKTPYEALGLTLVDIENMYGHAYKKFESGIYEEAESWFRFLHRMKSDDPRFLLGLGGCYHMRKQPLQAIYPYLKAYELDTTQALPLFFLTDCFLQLENKKMAATIIDLILMQFGNNPLYSTSIERYKLIRENLGPAFTYERILEEGKKAEEYLKRPFIDIVKEIAEEEKNDGS